MLQVEFSISEHQCDFLNNFHLYGFKDKSSMLRSAIEHLERELKLQRLTRSAELYAEVYEEDDTLQVLTEAAAEGWAE